jgi:purine-binding chemotaxis protein CheW
MNTSNLATALETGQDKSFEGQYLTFRLDGEMYAFSISHVKEILEYQKVTHVPMMPDFIQGVINLRGEVVPVVNLSKRFKLDGGDITKRTCIVIIEVETSQLAQDIGVVVDSVSEVLDIDAEAMRASPSFGTSIDTRFIQSMARHDDGFVIILDHSQVLSVEQIANLTEITASLEQVRNYEDAPA